MTKLVRAMKPYYSEDGITIYHRDCREVLPTLEPVDLVLTDPPYGIAHGFEGHGGKGKHESAELREVNR